MMRFRPVSRIAAISVITCVCAITAAASVKKTCRTELWPFFEWVDNDDETGFTVRPLFKAVHDRQDDTRRVDLLYPVLKWERGPGAEMQWWVTPLAYYMRHTDPAGRTESDMAVLPVLFAGETNDGTEDYFAVFPLGGSLKNFMGIDNIKFVMFPLYVRTENEGYVAKTVVWPILSRGKGENMSSWRVWPLYGERRADGEIVRRSVLWPIYTAWQGEDRSGRLVFPVYYNAESQVRRVKAVVPPLFLYSERKDLHERMWYMPWPVVEVRRGENVDVTRVWPVWGSSKKGAKSSGFVCWPFYLSSDVRDETSDQRSRRIMIVWLSETDTKPKVGKKDSYKQLWPLFHWSKEEGESERSEFNMLSPIWFRTYTERFYDMYGPFWTLYRHESRGGWTADHVLGRMVSVERGPDRQRVALWPVFSYLREGRVTEWNVLKGLIGRRNGPDRDETQVLWFIKLPGRR